MSGIKGVRTEMVNLTPEAAEKLLRQNYSNRNLLERRVRELVRVIQDGQWKLTHQGIAVGPDGRLLDGQHRCSAIARAGKAVPIMVTHLPSEDVFDVIDTGRGRTARDVLAVAGVPNAQVLPAAMRLVTHYRGPNADASIGGGTKLTNTDVVKMAEREPLFAERAAQAQRLALAVGRRGYVTPLLAALVLIETGAPEVPDTRAEFFGKLEDPVMLTEGSPVLALRRWLTVTVPTAKMGAKQGQYVLYGVLRAWNAYVEGRPMGRIAGHRERDNAPTVSAGPVERSA